MRRRSVAVAIVAVLSVLAAGCFPDPTGTAPLRYRDAVFSSVAVTSDVVYGAAVNEAGQNVTLTMDVYRPVGDAVTSRPVLVLVHGGGFSGGDKTSPELVDQANVFAKMGYVAASINYRVYSPGCSFAAPTLQCLLEIGDAQHDAQTAVRFLRANAATYGIDPARVAIDGSSAGAIIALNVGYHSDDPGTGGYADQSSAVEAAVSLSGTALPPSTHFAPGSAPALLFHSSNDPLVPFALAQETVESAQAAGFFAVLYDLGPNGHVPYTQFRTFILNQESNFAYYALDLAHAAQ